MPHLRLDLDGEPRQLIAALLAFDQQHAPPGTARFAVILFHGKDSTMGELTITDETTTLTGTVSFLDAKGATVPPDSTPTWTSSDETVATVEASDDGLTATITVGAPGVTIIEASEQETDTESGDVSAVVAQGTLTVQPGDAVIGSVEFQT
jgi:hypothetical protein